MLTFDFRRSTSLNSRVTSFGNFPIRMLTNSSQNDHFSYRQSSAKEKSPLRTPKSGRKHIRRHVLEAILTRLLADHQNYLERATSCIYRIQGNQTHGGGGSEGDPGNDQRLVLAIRNTE